MLQRAEFLSHIPSNSQSLPGNASQWLMSKRDHTSFYLRWSRYTHPAVITDNLQLAGSALSSP